MEPPREPSRAAAVGAALRRHPVITGVMIGSSVLGIALGLLLLPPEWSLLRRVLAGAVGGAGTGLLVTATKMLG